MELWCGHCAGTRGARMFDSRHPAQHQHQAQIFKFDKLSEFAGLLQQHSEMWQPLTGLMVFDIFVTLEGFMLICSHSNSLICCEVFSLNKDTQQLEVVKIQKCFHGLSRIFTMINSEFVVIPHFFYSAHDVIQLNILIYFIV